jgi:hypothetical protein
MKNHYKNFNTYVNGLKKWIIKLKDLNSTYKFRIFIDNNIYQDKIIMDVINQNLDLIQPILFTCSNYMLNGFHVDVFGALVRYFPLFNFDENDTNNVFVVDIDLHDEDWQKFVSMLKYNKSVTVNGHIDDFFKINEVYVFSNLMHFNSIKYDKNLFIDFIKNASNIKDIGKYEKRLTPFGYGTDEIFINNYLMKKINIIHYQIQYNPNWFIYYNLELIKKNVKSYKILRYILGEYYENKFDLDEMIKFIDESFYQIHKRTVINNYLTKRIYKILKYMFRNNIDWMKKSDTKFILKVLAKQKIILGCLHFKINLENKKIIDTIIYDPVYTE